MQARLEATRDNDAFYRGVAQPLITKFVETGPALPVDSAVRMLDTRLRCYAKQHAGGTPYSTIFSEFGHVVIDAVVAPADTGQVYEAWMERIEVIDGQEHTARQRKQEAKKAAELAAAEAVEQRRQKRATRPARIAIRASIEPTPEQHASSLPKPPKQPRKLKKRQNPRRPTRNKRNLPSKPATAVYKFGNKYPKSPAKARTRRGVYRGGVQGFSRRKPEPQYAR